MSADEVVAKTQPSVVKIHGRASSCQKVLEGSGFVIAPDKVMTNAHVVAGAESFSVDAAGKTYDAQVVSYDPNVDISILAVPNLPVRPLELERITAPRTTDVLVLGYPGGDSFVATAATISDVIDLSGPDIYHTTRTVRQAYIIKGTFPKAGSSGGPLVDLSGRVLGVYFGAHEEDHQTGFALTESEIEPQLANIADTQAVSTGACVD